MTMTSTVTAETKQVGETAEMTSNTYAYDEEKWMQPFYRKPHWIPCEIILALLTVFSIYVFICVVRYTVAKKPSPGRDMSGKQGKRLHSMCIIASGLAVLRFISDHAVAFLGSNSDYFCFVTVAVSTVFYALSILSVYVFLWMRQSIFYANPVLAKVLNKGVTFASWSTLFVMLISAVCLTVLYNLPQVTGWKYEVTEAGCMEVSIEEIGIVSAITVATTVYFQLSLLALFLYPLLSRKTQRYRSAGKGTERSSQHHSSISNTDENATDGDVTTSHSIHSPRSHVKTNIIEPRKKETPLESDIESGVDLQGHIDSAKSSEISGNGSLNGLKRNSSSLPSKGNLPVIDSSETTKLSAVKNKRPSIFTSTRIFKAGSLFYRRNQSKLGTVPQSPTAKRSRAKTLSTVSMRMESEESSKERKMSNGSSKSDSGRKLRRRAKRTQQGRRMMAYLKKSFYIMMVCVVTDVMATIVQDAAEVPELVYLVVFDLSLMVNVICIILSFRDWDLMLLPMCTNSSIRRNRSVMDSCKSSVRPDPIAAKRRADALRFVGSNAAGYEYPPEVHSPNAMQYHRSRLGKNGAGSFSKGKFSDQPSPTAQTAHSLPAPTVNSSIDLNGKT